MNPIDKKKCADLLRSMCADLEKTPHYADIRAQVNHLRKYADNLWPPDKNAYTETQWEGLKAGLKWNGTPDELEAGLEKMKERNWMSDVRGRPARKTAGKQTADKKSEKPEIAY